MNKIIETKRLLLRQFTLTDAPDLYKLDNNPLVMKHISSYIGEEKTIEDCRKTIKRQQDYYQNHEGLGIWATVLKEDDTFIGWTTLKYLDDTKDVELGYRYLPAYWNKGYATEASKALLQYGFTILRLDRIMAIAVPENKASIRVMEKIGMNFIRTDFYYNSHVVLYQITKDSKEL